MSSSANVNVNNVQLSPVRVTYNGVDVGGTFKGVKVGAKEEYTDIKLDQLGDTPVDKRLKSQAYTVSFVLAEIQNKDNWKLAFPNAKLINSSGNKAIYVDSQIGASAYSTAKQLILHPLEKSDSDKSGDILFWKAACMSAVEIEYSSESPAGLAVELAIFPDTSVSPARYFLFGDPALGVVAATAGAPSFSGTGNGTCTLVSVGASTITETITITCIGTNGANKSAWKVEGSVSGAIGTVSLTGGAGGTGVFSSSNINFTLTDGTTDFVVGDAFTIVTTGPNYA